MKQHATLLASKPATHTEEGGALGRTAVVPTKAVQPAVPSMSTTRSGHDFSRVPVRRGSAEIIQPKLRFSQPGDRSEREADRIADAVMRTPAAPQAALTEMERSPEPLVQRQIDKTDQGPPVTEQEDVGSDEPIAVLIAPENLDRPAEGTERPEDGTEDAGTVQLKEAGPRPQPTRPSLHPSAVTASDGRPMGQGVRSDMEQRFGADFGAIQLHTDARSDALCRSIGARAFTYQNHIHMAANQYAPSTAGGQHLLAHELAHTLQQGAAHSVDAAPDAARVQPQAGMASGAIQRAIDLSTQFDTYSLIAVKGAVPITGGSATSVIRGMEDTAYASFGARAPIMDMSVTDTWYFYNPFTTVYATRNKWIAKGLGRYWYRANDVHRFTFNYRHTATRPQTGTFSSASGKSDSETKTLAGGAKLSYSFLELDASASTTTGSGSTAGTTATSADFYEHDYDVSLTYNSTYYNQSDFTTRWHWWYGSRIHKVGGPHTLSGTVPIGTCTVKDDDNNADNLTP